MSRTTTETVESLTTRHVLPRVNLLPPEVHEARRARKVQLGLAAGVAVVAVAVGGVYLMQVQNANRAKDNLASVQAQSTTLQAQQLQYADVPKTLAAIDAAEAARQTAMGSDVQWYRYLNDLSFVTPKNSYLTTLDVTLTPPAQTGTTGAAAASATPAGVATVTVTGNAKQHNDVARWLDAAARESGWENAYFTNSEKADVNGSVFVKFASTATVTDEALSHRYDRKAS
jgi:Tfp pilus assembly protein PilN